MEWRHIQFSIDGKFFGSVGKATSIVLLGNHFREKLIEDLPAQVHSLDGISKVICGPKQGVAGYLATKRMIVDLLKGNNGHNIQVVHSTLPMH